MLFRASPGRDAGTSCRRLNTARATPAASTSRTSPAMPPAV